VTDFKTPRMDGIRAGRKLIEDGLCRAVILLTLYDGPSLIREALEAGIRGYVVKMDAGRELVAAIRAVSEGKTFSKAGPH
jgi:DNA-binding NarL/FixJ family response regulator